MATDRPEKFSALHAALYLQFLCINEQNAGSLWQEGKSGWLSELCKGELYRVPMQVDLQSIVAFLIEYFCPYATFDDEIIVDISNPFVALNTIACALDRRDCLKLLGAMRKQSDGYTAEHTATAFSVAAFLQSAT